MKKIIFLAGFVLLLGGCNMNGAGVKAQSQNLNDLSSIPKGTTWENIGIPTEGVEPITDEFSGSKWTGQVGQEKYQIRFDPENNICRIYIWGHIKYDYQKWYYDNPCFRKYEDGKIVLDFKPYIDYVESYSMRTFWIETYAMLKDAYEDSKRIFENTIDPEIKEKVKKDIESFGKSVKKCETFESFKKEENVDEAFQLYKNSRSKRAAGLKAVNPVIGTLSADKKTLTVKKMFIRLKKDATPEYAENVVFTRK